jgi:quinol monooxygenase YgiN
MIVITGTVPTKADKRDVANAAMVTMQTASLAEPGCNKYQFGWSTQDPALAMIFEEWVDQAALEAHFASPHMTTFGATLAEVVAGPGNFTKYEVTSSGPLRP